MSSVLSMVLCLPKPLYSISNVNRNLILERDQEIASISIHLEIISFSDNFIADLTWLSDLKLFFHNFICLIDHCFFLAVLEIFVERSRSGTRKVISLSLLWKPQIRHIFNGVQMVSISWRQQRPLVSELIMGMTNLSQQLS